MDENIELKERIMEAAIEEFNEKSLKFTMSDIAKKLEISKKTIYTVFKDKEDLCLQTIDYGFKAIKDSEGKIYSDDTMDISEKIRRIIIAMPDRYKAIDWRRIYNMKEKHQKLYKRITLHVQTEWDRTIELLEKGMGEGKIRDISIPVFKAMTQSAIEGFISSTALMDNDIPYEEALNEMADILLEGIKAK